LENSLQEQQLIDFHRTIASNQQHFYGEVNQPHSWDIDTTYLNSTPLATPQQLSLA